MENRKLKNERGMTDSAVGRLAAYGLMTAVIAVLTLFASIPLPTGSGGAYLNAGDVAVYFSAWLFGPLGGAATAAVGSALADLLHGSAIYAPATFIIKGLMGLLCGLLFKKIKCGALPIAGLVMPTGYFAYEYLLYDISAALYGLWTNAIQYTFGVVAGIVLIVFAGKSSFINRLRDRF